MEASKAIDSLTLQGVKGDELTEIKKLSETIKAFIGEIPTSKSYNQASVFFEDYSAIRSYRSRKTISLGSQFANWVYKQFTGGDESHAGIMLSKEINGPTSRSHVTDKYHNDTRIPSGIGFQMHSVPYKVNCKNLLTDEGEKAIKDLGVDLEALWRKASQAVHHPEGKTLDSLKIKNSRQRQLNAGVTPNRDRGKDNFKEWRDIPKDRKTMICSEFTIIALIATANRFNDLLKDALPEDQRPNFPEKLAEFPLPGNIQLQAVTPPYIREHFSGGEKPILERLELPNHLQGFLAMPK